MGSILCFIKYSVISPSEYFLIFHSSLIPFSLSLKTQSLAFTVHLKSISAISPNRHATFLLQRESYSSWIVLKWWQFLLPVPSHHWVGRHERGTSCSLSLVDHAPSSSVNILSLESLAI